MKSRKASLVFLGTTALCTAAILCNGIASAQTANSHLSDTNTQINLGSVTAQGDAQGSGGDSNGYVAPSGTGTQAQAIAKQRAAPNITYVQPGSVMATQPAQNIAENAQHMPGVAMESGSGYGRFLVVRGLSEDLNATQYGGINLPPTNVNASPTKGGRAVALDFLPPGVIGGMELISTLTPDMPATGLGGVINLLPPALPSDGSPLLDVNAGGGFSNLLGKPLGEASVTLGGHFAIPGIETENPKPFSFVGSFGYNNLNGGIFDLEESYTGKTAAGQPAMLNQIQSRQTQNNRTARGYTGELDFDPNPGVHMYLRGLYSSMTETIAATNLNLNNLDGTAGGSVVNNGNNNFTATGANLTKHFEDSVERTGMALIEGGGKFLVGNQVTVDLHSAYAEGFDNFGPDWASNFNSNNQNLTINYSTANPNLRTWTIANAAGRPFAVNNPKNFTFANLQTQSQTSITQIYDNAISASVPTSFLDTIGTFKVGGDVTLTHRGASQNTVNGTPLGGPFSLASVTSGQGDITNYGGLYDNGTALNQGVYRGLPWSFTPDTVGNQLSQQQDQENVYAGFWQEQLQYGRLGVLAGMRLEATDASYSGFGSTTDAGGNVTVDPHMTTRTQNYVNVFPSVQFNYALTNDLQARFAYSTGIARPGFQQINPANTLTILGGQGGRNLIISGNPNLAPQTVNSYDLAFSYYPDGHHDNVLEADFFVKDISNYIAPFTTNTATTTFQTFENLKGAQARGIVLNAIQHFRSLPAPFDGLGINANAAFVDGTANIQGQGKTILPETYPLTFNVTEMYEKGPVQFHLLESYTSKNLFAVGTDASTNVYTQPMFRMDADMEYQLTPQWQLWFQAHNLTNTHLRYTQSSSNQFPIQDEYYGQSFLFGVHFHMG